MKGNPAADREPKVIVQSASHRIVRHYPPDEIYPTYTFEDKRASAMDRTMHFVEIVAWSMRPEEKLPSHFILTGDLFIEMIRLIDGEAIPLGGPSFIPPMSNNGPTGEQAIH